MRVIYLDQNKWIELATAAKYPDRAPAVHDVLRALEADVYEGRLILPLTATNIYETHKINNPERRTDVAAVQAMLSRGAVFRGRHKRLEVEFNLALRPAFGLPPVKLAPYWFLSNVFFEAFTEWGDSRVPLYISERSVMAIRSDPARSLYDFLVQTPEHIRVQGVKQFTTGSEAVCAQIEDRRARHANESMAMRVRIQSALLMLNEIDLLMRFAAEAGLPWKTVADIGRENSLRIVNDMPTFYVEREMAVRIEAARSRAIHPNDLRDMQSFCAVVRYADGVVAENMFSNVARQAKLDRKYQTNIHTSLLSLADTAAAKAS